MAKYSCPGILPCLIYPSTAKAAAGELLAAIEGTNRSVVGCTSLDATTQANWATFYTTAKPFLLEDPGLFGLGTRMDRIASYADDLYEWQKQLAGKACSLAVPVVDPSTIPPETSALVNLGRWTAFAVIAAASAYGIGRVVAVIPTSSGPSRPSLGARAGAHVGRAKATAAHHMGRVKAALHRATA